MMPGEILVARTAVSVMMFFPNSLVRQKEGAQEQEEEEAGGRRKAGLTGTPTPNADAPTGLTDSSQGCRMRGT